MTDRELLELAAKAAGMELDYTIRPDKKAFYHSERNALALVDGGWFAPLTDDGDALRLAVRLRIDVLFDGRDSPNAHVETVANEPAQETQPWAHEPLKFEENAATRRAIVRAAAEIQLRNQKEKSYESR